MSAFNRWECGENSFPQRFGRKDKSNGRLTNGLNTTKKRSLFGLAMGSNGDRGKSKSRKGEEETMARFSNQTGRDLTIYSSRDDQQGVKIPSEGKVEYKGFAARGKVVPVNGLPVACAPETAPAAPRAEDIVGLPEPVKGTVFIVPFPVLAPAYAIGRRDVIGMGAARIVGGTQTGAEGFNYPGTAAELETLLAE
ncbi:hypothetical protein HYS28_02570 [Candidatus Uhrbacteria bacterium]|nr:hypothetical protein [Candidatus Uhrbacteria bacterium]